MNFINYFGLKKRQMNENYFSKEFIVNEINGLEKQVDSMDES